MAEQGRFDEAVKHFRDALQINPDSVKSHNRLGEAFSAQGKLDEAVMHFKKVLSLDPDKVWLLNELAW